MKTNLTKHVIDTIESIELVPGFKISPAISQGRIEHASYETTQFIRDLNKMYGENLFNQTEIKKAFVNKFGEDLLPNEFKELNIEDTGVKYSITEHLGEKDLEAVA